MIKILFNTLLGIVLIFIWTRFVDLGQIISTISKVNILSLILVFLFMLLSPIIRALRLKIFLAEIKNIPFTDLVYLNGLAMMLNFFIPIRAGEIAKGVYLNTKYSLPLGKSVAWIFIDRFVDFLVVLLLASLFLIILPTQLSQNFAFTILVLFILVLIITYLTVFHLSFSKKIVNFLRYLLIEKNIKIYFDRFTGFILQSFSILDRHPKDLSLMVLITVIAYGIDALIWYFTFNSLGFTQDFWKMYLGQLLAGLAYLVPAAPGYIGSAEASGLLILSGVFGIEANLASAMTVLFHISSAVFLLVFGLISVFNLKVNLGLILRKALKKE